MPNAAIRLLCALSTVAMPGVASAASSDLVGTGWRPTQIGSVQPEAAAMVGLAFETDTRASGNGGCNGFSAQYEVSAERISFGPIAATRMACPQPIMEVETAFLNALENAATFQRGESSLVLFDETGAELARFEQTDPG